MANWTVKRNTPTMYTVSIQKCWLYSCYSFNGKVLKCGWLELFCLKRHDKQNSEFLIWIFMVVCAVHFISNGLMSCGFLQRWSNVMTTFPSIVTTETTSCNENNAIVFGVSHIIKKENEENFVCFIVCRWNSNMNFTVQMSYVH